MNRRDFLHSLWASGAITLAPWERRRFFFDVGRNLHIPNDTEVACAQLIVKVTSHYLNGSVDVRVLDVFGNILSRSAVKTVPLQVNDKGMIVGRGYPIKETWSWESSAGEVGSHHWVNKGVL